MDEEKQTLCTELNTIDTTLGFLLLIILSIFLSYKATLRQRQALCLTLLGDEEGAARTGDVYSLRLGANALVVGALGYFFMLALQTCQDADPSDPVSRHSARMNLIAGFLVLLAALIRLFNLNFVRRTQSSSTEELPPD